MKRLDAKIVQQPISFPTFDRKPLATLSSSLLLSFECRCCSVDVNGDADGDDGELHLLSPLVMAYNTLLLLVVLFQEGHWRQLHEDPQYLDGWKAVVRVARESDQSDFWLTMAFATSDLTARGVDSDAYRECSELAVGDRLPVS